MASDKDPKTNTDELSYEDIKSTHPPKHHPPRRALPLVSTPPVRPKTNWLSRLWHNHKLPTIAGLTILLALIIIGGITYARKPKTTKIAIPIASPTPTPEPPKPSTKASPLTGVEVDPAKADQPVMASVIENLVGTGNARPQSGLSSAGVVYEALSEGGITRYLAIFQADVPTDIGPVRSLRPIFYDAAVEYGAPVAHAGGSTDGLALAHNDHNFKDMDQFYNGKYFRRITTRYAPHNLFVYGAQLQALVKDKGWATTPTFTPWPRKDDSPSTTPDAQSISIDFSGADYRASFSYDLASDSYLRSIAGVADVDMAANKKQVNPKTVIVIYTSTVYGTQPNGKPKTDIDITGTGKGIVFQDGNATPINWTKTGPTARIKFADANGKEVSLNRGQSWISVVPNTQTVSYK